MNRSAKIILITLLVIGLLSGVAILTIVATSGGFSKNKKDDATNITETDKDSSNNKDSMEPTIGKEQEKGPDDNCETIDYISLLRAIKTDEHVVAKVNLPDRDALVTMADTALTAGMCDVDSPTDYKAYASGEVNLFDERILHDHMCDNLSMDYTDEGGFLLKTEEVKTFLSVFYGRPEIETWSEWLYDNGDGTTTFMTGDGEPWIMLYNPTFYENENYYVLCGPCFYGSNGGEENVYRYYSDFVFEKNDESPMGGTLVYSQSYEENADAPEISSITASSTLPAADGKNYEASNLIDGDITSVWVEGVPGYGVGESVVIKLKEKTWVHGLTINTGYQATHHLFTVNSKPSEITANFGDTSVDYEMYICDVGDDGSMLDGYEACPYWCQPDHAVFTDEIKIIIKNVEPGTKYDDTCISELAIY